MSLLWGGVHLKEMTPHKVLVVTPQWVGDIVIAQSLLKVLKERNPKPEIHVLAPEWAEGLLACMPEVDKVIPLSFKHGEFGLLKRYRIAQTLKQERYQQAIVLPNSFKSALIPFFANIPLRTGYRGEMRWGLLNDIRQLDKKKHPSLAERFVALGIGRDMIVQNVPRPCIASAALQPRNDGPVLALCPGAMYGPAKRWPAAYFAYVANHYLQKNWQVWIFGAASDKSVADEIQALTHQACKNLAGKTELKEAINLLAQVDAVVTNDSGLMHIAAALNRPLVAVYGSSDPTYTPPLGKFVEMVSLRLSCSPCFERECPLVHLNCLKQLSPTLVLNALEKVLTHAHSYR